LLCYQLVAGKLHGFFHALWVLLVFWPSFVLHSLLRICDCLGVKPLIHHSELRTYTKVVPFQEKGSFHFVVLWKLLNGMEVLKLIIEVKYWRVILSPNLMDLVVFWYLYGGFDAWPINTEFSWDDRAIFRVGGFHSRAFHCKILSMPWYFERQNVEESCLIQKIYGLGKIKL
jgi:hypothetical protein